MPATMGQLESSNVGTQGNLIGEFSEPNLIILKKTTGDKRGTYLQRRVGKYASGKLVSLVVGELDYNGDHYIKLTNGTLLQEKRRDIYEWYARRIASKTWRDGLASTTPVAMTGVSLTNEWLSPY